MSNHQVDVVGIGASAWNRFLVVPRYPEPDETVRAIHYEECAGGSVATALVALRRWGLGCRYVGMLGHDECSERIFDDFKQEGVDVGYVVRQEDADGRRNTVIVDNRTGRRSVIGGPHRAPPVPVEAIGPALFDGARVLHLDTSVDECCVEAAVMAKQAGLRVTLHAEQPCKRTPELMRACDYIIATHDFAEQCTGQSQPDRSAYALHLQTEKPVVVTNGAKGCDFASADLSFHQAAFHVPVVDRTGAGDVFRAAFIYGLLAAWDIHKTVRFAAWAAAITCRELDSRKGIPSLDAVREFIHNDHQA